MEYRGAFANAKKMFAAIEAALALPAALQGEAIGKIEPYRSRGKGRGTVGRNYFRPYLNSEIAFQGKRECARRVRQADACASTP